jgi:hypothetical protein
MSSTVARYRCRRLGAMSPVTGLPAASATNLVAPFLIQVRDPAGRDHPGARLEAQPHGHGRDALTRSVLEPNRGAARPGAGAHQTCTRPVETRSPHCLPASDSLPVAVPWPDGHVDGKVIRTHSWPPASGRVAKERAPVAARRPLSPNLRQAPYVEVALRDRNDLDIRSSRKSCRDMPKSVRDILLQAPHRQVRNPWHQNPDTCTALSYRRY